MGEGTLKFFILLVGMQNETATLENCLTVSCKINIHFYLTLLFCVRDNWKLCSLRSLRRMLRVTWCKRWQRRALSFSSLHPVAQLWPSTLRSSAVGAVCRCRGNRTGRSSEGRARWRKQAWKGRTRSALRCVHLCKKASPMKDKSLLARDRGGGRFSLPKVLGWWDYFVVVVGAMNDI